MIFSLSLIGFVLLAIILSWKYRTDLLEQLPASIRSKLRHYAPLNTFEEAMENGFSTANFDLSGNIHGGDSRAGMDERSLIEVRRIMEELNVQFDEARLIRTKRIFKQNGIDEDGYPLDSKAITSLS